MRKSSIILFVLTLIVAAAGVHAQSTGEFVLQDVTSVRDLDFTSASIHQAGPAAFYIRGVGIGDDYYSLTFSQDTSGIWSLTSLNTESENVLPQRTVLDFASLIPLDDQTLIIDGVFVDGEVYSGSFAVGEEGELQLEDSVEAGSLGAINEARSLALRQLAVAETTEEFEEALAEQRAELEAMIDQVETQRDDYKAERDNLASELAELRAASGSPASSDGTAASRIPGMIELPPSITVTEDTPVTAEQVTSLINERNTLAGEMVGLLAENNQLRDEKKSLSEQIAELQTENGQLRAELVAMTSEVERLTELVGAYRSSTGGVPIGEEAPTGGEAPASSETAESDDGGGGPEAPATWTVPGDYLRKADLEAAAEAVREELRALEDRVAGLEQAAAGLAGLEEALRTGVADGFAPSVATREQPGELIGSDGPDPSVEAREAPEAPVDGATAEPEIERLTRRLEELVEQNQQLRLETQALETRILNDILENGLVAMMRGRLTQTVNAGFTGSVPDVGEWSVSGNRAVQADSDAFFAKLAVPASQGDGPVLYSFRVRSLDAEGWVGVGLHFFASGVEKRRGYGMGRSLLVWLTRDPDVYKTQLTYLQLYRSDDDINMGRVMDSVIEEPMNDFLNIEVLYEPENQYLTVAVDGEDKIRYRTWFGINSGVEVAVRSLGAAEFRDFRIQVGSDRSASLPGYDPIPF